MHHSVKMTVLHWTGSGFGPDLNWWFQQSSNWFCRSKFTTLISTSETHDLYPLPSGDWYDWVCGPSLVAIWCEIWELTLHMVLKCASTGLLMPELLFSNISGSQKGAEVRGLADLPGSGIGNTLSCAFPPGAAHQLGCCFVSFLRLNSLFCYTHKSEQPCSLQLRI